MQPASRLNTFNLKRKYWDIISDRIENTTWGFRIEKSRNLGVQNRDKEVSFSDLVLLPLLFIPEKSIIGILTESWKSWTWSWRWPVPAGPPCCRRGPSRPSCLLRDLNIILAIWQRRRKMGLNSPFVSLCKNLILTLWIIFLFFVLFYLFVSFFILLFFVFFQIWFSPCG